MRQARSGTYLYPVPRVPRPRRFIAWPLVVLALVIAAAVTHAMAFAMGRAFGQGESELREPKVVTKYVTPQWSCNAAERRQYVEACRVRALNGFKAKE